MTATLPLLTFCTGSSLDYYPQGSADVLDGAGLDCCPSFDIEASKEALPVPALTKGATNTLSRG